MNIFITRPIPNSGIAYLKRQQGFRVVVRKDDSQIPRRELLKSVRGADAILAILTDRIDAEVMDAAGKQLKVVANYAVGFDNLDRQAAKQRNIILTNAPAEEVSEAVADHTLALMLALAHRVVEADMFTRRGKYKGWGPNLLLGTDLNNKTLGIVGMGRIGQAVARRAHGFGMKILYENLEHVPEAEQKFDAKKTTLKTLLKQSDVVSLHIPLLPSTKYLIDAPELKLMKKTAFIINTARGPIIREIALQKALKQKTIAGAGLDVFECEPFIDCNPNDHLTFRELDNVIMTPHTASATIEAREAMSLIAAKNIAAVLRGKPPRNPIA